MGGDTHLAQMANDIGAFFRAEPRRQDAIDGIANHINRFWTRRMRQKLLEQARQGDADLDELVTAALAKVVAGPPAVSAEAAATAPPGPEPTAGQ